MILRKLTTVLALAALVTASTGDATSFCTIACASGALHLGLSNVALGHHFGHSQSLPQNAAMHHYMSMTANAQSPSVTAFGGMVALQLPQCSRFRQFAALLDGSGAVASDLSNSDVVAAPAPVDLDEVTTQAAPLLTESPPRSAVSQLSATSILRI